MKTRRIASSIALAAALALGATGCSLIAPQGTQEPYAPSDGIDANIENIAIRNIMLIADQSGGNFNVVFTGVNNTMSDATVRMTFVSESTEASTDFVLAPGLSAFGHPDGEFMPQLVSLPNVQVGSTVEVYMEVAGGGEENFEVPVLDGTLEEYKAYVITKAQMGMFEQGDRAVSKKSSDAATMTEESAANEAAAE